MFKGLLKTGLFAVTLASQSMPCGDLYANEIKDYRDSVDTFTVIQKPKTMIIGIACRTSNNKDAAPQDIPKLWQKFYEENIQSKVPNKVSDEVVALYCDYEGDYTQPYLCVIGLPVDSLDEIPEGMVGKTIPASNFALFRAVGEFPKSVADTWGHIWSSDLKRTYVGDYEVYGHKFSQPSKEVEVLVAIESQSSE